MSVMTTHCDVTALCHMGATHVMSTYSFYFHLTVLQEIFTGLKSLCLEEMEEINRVRKCYKT